MSLNSKTAYQQFFMAIHHLPSGYASNKIRVFLRKFIQISTAQHLLNDLQADQVLGRKNCTALL
jgi:hypothetical protein